MSLPAGTRLGPYEILGAIGAGGMGEVYKARDTRIGRAVAIKVLPRDVETDEERRRRFHQEAVAAGALNHPNVVVVHDLGHEDGRPYLVTELLQGKTLREVLRRGPLPEAAAVRYAAALLDGLTAAHAHGIVHRDLKPENIFITDDETPKILDFGLAKMSPGFRWNDGTAVTSPATEHGVVLGSVGYMAPEQITDGPIDHRTDLFSMAVVLYEMLTGHPPFRGGSAIEVLNAIVTADVVPAATTGAPLQAVLHRGLQKPAARRFQSASDFAFSLRQSQAPASTRGERERPRKTETLAALAAALAIAVAALGVMVVRQSRTSPQVSSDVRYQRITFQSGRVWSARFIPGSDAIMYSASWNGEANRVYSARAGFPAPTELHLPPADLLGVSQTGELALLLGRRWMQGMEPSTGMLARAPAAGSSPRELAENVTSADWAPDGQQLAAVRDIGRVRRLEFPLGHSIYETAGWIGSLRVSHDGTRVAFTDHPVRGDDRGDYVVADQGGRLTRVLRDLASVGGVAWSPDDRELWLSHSGQVIALTMDGRQRVVYRDPRTVTLLDVASDGRLLIAVEQRRAGLNGRLEGDPAERDLTWFEYSVARDLDAGGKALLFFEASELARGEYIVGLWRAGDPAPIRIGEGHPTSLSGDGNWAIAAMLTKRTGLRLLPTGAGTSREIPTPGLTDIHWATLHPDAQHIVLTAHEPDRGARLYMIDMSGRIIRPIGPEGIVYQWNGISPDGSSVVAQDPERRLTIYPLDGGAPSAVAGTSPDERPISWTAGGTELFVLGPGIPSRVSRVNVKTGNRTPWRDLLPSDPTGVIRISPVLITPDGRSYAYTYGRFLSTLYVVSGVH